RLREDVLTDQASLSEVVSADAAVVLLHRHRQVLTHGEAATVEVGVHPHRSALEAVADRGARLVEVAEADRVALALPAAADGHVGVERLAGAEDLVPPVRAGAARHDEAVRVAVA